MRNIVLALAGVAVLAAATGAAAQPERTVRHIFPLQNKHVHGSSLVELPNGDLLAAWFHGSGERSANDVVIQGARLKQGADEWSPVFVLADYPDLPDCNPTLWLDKDDKLWLFWITVRANRWEHSVLMYRTSEDYLEEGPPVWDWQGVIILKPGEEFPNQIREGFSALNADESMWGEYALPYPRLVVEAARDPIKRQEGWMTRNHPVQLPSGRIILPLYHDGFNLALVALSDDGGETWRASAPIVALAGIQPTVARKRDGTLVAYMRNTGGEPRRVPVSTSTDDGETWSPGVKGDIPNPSSSLQVRVLEDGLWAMVYNDTERNRGSMALALSDDEGATWRWKRNIGATESYGYPSMIQSKDGRIHISYSYNTRQGSTINHEVMNVEWIQAPGTPGP